MREYNFVCNAGGRERGDEKGGGGGGGGGGRGGGIWDAVELQAVEDSVYDKTNYTFATIIKT